LDKVDKKVNDMERMIRKPKESNERMMKCNTRVLYFYLKLTVLPFDIIKSYFINDMS